MKYVFALVFMAGAAHAQDGPSTFGLPQGCDAFLTVQSKSCQVDHHFVCEADPEGHQRRVGITEEGLVYAGEIDRETQWLNSFHARTGHAETLEPNPVERASLSDLIAKGVDDYDFRTLSDQIGTTRYVGQDTLTGRQIVIDGVTLDETTYDITAYDESGNEIWAAKGNEFIHRDWRIFLSGTGVTRVGTESFDSDDGPVEFIFPGESGFLSARPKYGCGVAISQSDILKENTHDNL
ncbi:hypothetical protein [Yoonia sediminilitoris]|uniref:Uncharacterized protein n=1 Tax=Yoonia sediminilitoris TaxID=1286148 RepID=A0A2T6KLF3_9RHOB|nr:hypothetical protein [Yoonia sediminilitoris]PUB16997.1 hypothetical protein C8N45_1027 [Yoonia sediminilitoris]RCW97292.1 hypothetical protein DFP92_1027 [Yoonia sediminilitoris]